MARSGVLSPEYSVVEMLCGVKRSEAAPCSPRPLRAAPLRFAAIRLRRQAMVAA